MIMPVITVNCFVDLNRHARNLTLPPFFFRGGVTGLPLPAREVRCDSKGCLQRLTITRLAFFGWLQDLEGAT